MRLPRPTCIGCEGTLRWIPTGHGRNTPCDPDVVEVWITADMRQAARRVQLITEDGTMLNGWEATADTPGARLIQGYEPHWRSCKQEARRR